MKRYILFGITLLMAFPLSVVAQDEDTEEEEEVQVKRVVRVQKHYETRTVKGYVFDAATQKPVSGAIVRAADIDGYSVLTDDDGSYSLKLPLFSSSLYVSSPDHNPVKIGLSKDSEQKSVNLYPSTFKAEYGQQTNVRGDFEATDFKYTNAINIKDEIQMQCCFYLVAPV